MWKSATAALSDANKWAQDADSAAIRKAFGEILFALTKLFFALVYFVIGLGFILAGSVETVFNRGRGALDEKRERKLKSHLNWDRPAEETRSTGVLRR